MIQGEVYKLVIDSGTCNNLISWDVVNALKLPIQHHPKPYYATWVEDNQNFIVHHQAMITFSIGEYTDQVLCDVVNMNYAHVILGRSWQVSRKVVHDCFTNIYQVWSNRKRFELLPLPCKGNESLLIGRVKELDTGQSERRIKIGQQVVDKGHKILSFVTELGTENKGGEGVIVGEWYCPIRGHDKDNEKMMQQ